jgi:uncharacterized protein YjiS (DUF1127 family)
MNSLIHPLLTDYHLSSRTSRATRPSLLARAAATLRLWRKRIREKEALSRLDDRDLHDFGASYSDVYAELRRPFWRAPPPC